MKILVLGKQGWLGDIFYNYVKTQGGNITYSDTNINLITSFASDITHVVNFAAKANIDWCESNKNATFYSNVLGAVNLARTCKAFDKKYVFLSSGCVFQSANSKDIKYEDSVPNPACFYTRTKLMGEQLIKEIIPSSLIVRFRLPLSEVPHSRNALNKLSSYGKLLITRESAIIVEDAIPLLHELILKNETGDFNLSNAGTISPAEIGKAIGNTFEICSKEELDKEMEKQGRAHRVTTVLGTNRGYNLPPIQERIEDIVDKWKMLSKK